MMRNLPTREMLHLKIELELPWSEAKLVCSNRGLHLAFPQSDSDNFHLRHTIRYNYLSDPPLDRYSGFWVGGHRKINSDEFYWDNGQSIGWYGWVKHTPSTLLREDCVEMSPSIYNDEMMWTNTNCQKSQRYICYGRTTDEVSKADGSLTPGFKGNELWKNKRQLSSIVESDDNIRTMSPRPTTISSIATPITKSPSKSHQLPIIIAIENNPTTTLIPRSPSSQNSDSDSNTQSEPIHPTESPMREVWRRPHRHFHHIFATYLSNPDGFDEAHDMDIDCF
ncbi:uncharacterized protein [Euwallacea similis]|uniref:uncharacterized protein isoform X2 n=1 Tax=Euwallacea similis TaxID=1736056 RepID=UPI00344D60D6